MDYVESVDVSTLSPQEMFEQVERTAEIERLQNQRTVTVIVDEFTRALENDAPNRARQQRNEDMYAGLDGSQFNALQKAQAAAQGRNLQTINIVAQKVDALVGSMMKNQYDSSFTPVESAEAHQTALLNKVYLADKDIQDWDSSYEQLLYDGMKYEGVEEMYIDYSKDKLGRIAFRRHLPGHVVWDQFWKTVSAKDCRKCWRVVYLTARDMIRFWPHLRGKVEAQAIQEQLTGQDWDVQANGILPDYNLDAPASNTRFRVIVQYEMVDKDVEFEYERTTQKELPKTGDIAYKLAWLNNINPDWTKEDVLVDVRKQPTCMVTTVCPEINNYLIIEKKECEIQIGRIPFFPWSAARINGVCRGIVDMIYDVQNSLNFRENLRNFVMQTQANGAMIIDPMLFGNDDEKMNDFIENKNDPSRSFKSAPGATVHVGMPQAVTHANTMPDISADISRMLEYFDKLSKIPSVLEGRMDSANESGYLFAQRSQLADMQLYVLYSGLKRHLKEKGDAWFTQAKYQYCLGGVEREFVIGEEHFDINHSQTDEDTNEEVIVNDFASIPRHRVIISDSPSGVSTNLINRSIAVETMRTLPQECIATREVMATALCDTLDSFDDAVRDRLKIARELEENQAIETLKTNIVNQRVMRAKAEQELKMLESGQQPPPEAPAKRSAPGSGTGHHSKQGAGGGATHTPSGRPPMSSPTAVPGMSGAIPMIGAH